MPREEFATHGLTEAGLDAVAGVRGAFSGLLDTLQLLVPGGREWAVMVTKLQEAQMWAVRGVSVARQHRTT